MAKSKAPVKDTALNKEAAIVNRWLKEINLVLQNRRQQTFENIGERILRKFRNASDVDTVGTGKWQSNVMFNVLWSNVQVLEPALYSRMPKVVVERTFKDFDPIGRLAAEISERATHYNLMQQQDRFNYMMSAVVQDRLLVGRGISRLQYKAEFQTQTDDETGEAITDDVGNPVQLPKPNSERVEVVITNWLDYIESLARNQFEVRWRAFKIRKTRSELAADPQIGPEVAAKVQMDVDSTKNRKQRDDDDSEFLKQASIWVVEDEKARKVYWICDGYKDAPLKVLDDPNRLRDFWSCPLPLTATTTTDSTYPTADYVIYQGLADELNFVADRIKAIVNCIRLVGAHAASFNKEMKNITTLRDGDTWPIENWGGFREGGGFGGMLDWVPFDNCVAALPVLMQYQESLKAQIDEITSMPDIVRGSSDPNDPVYSQQQKSHWTVIKLVKKQQDVQRYCRQLISKMAQMIFEPGFFSDETIFLMAGVGQMPPEKQAMFPQALALLRDDRLNTFRVDIETDSTIAIDEEQAMGRWMQYLSSLKDILGEVEQVSTMSPEFMSPIIESALQTVRTLRTGRSVEGAWEKALDEWERAQKEAAENPQPPPPDPAMLKAQTDQQKVMQEGQIKQAEMQYEQQKCQFEQWEKSQRLQLDSYKIEGELALKAQEIQVDSSQVTSRAQIDKLFADIDLFQKQFMQKLEGQKLGLQQQKLEFDKAAKALEMQEKLMEERRLDKQEQLEAMRIVSDHAATIKAAETSSGGKEGGKSGPINIHLNTDQPITLKEQKKPRKKRHKIQRLPDGSFAGESEDIEDMVEATT